MSAPTIYDLCAPRPDVLSGAMSEGDFAARLGPVVNRTGHPDYVDPIRFFTNTYPTAGLKELLDQVLRRLSGTPGAVSSVFRLDTSFGGGKTHGLIALIHAARSAASIPNLAEFTSVTMPGTARVAAFDGEASDPTNGRAMGDGVLAYTPWGELAYQLRGRDGYERVRASDVERKAPGSETLSELLGDEPALIVLDEIGEYLRKSPGAGGRDQLAAFIKALFSAVESSPRAAVVFTLAVRADGKATDAFAAENEAVAKLIAEAESVSGRKATILNPTGDDETVAVLRRRLFETIRPGAADEVAAAYATVQADKRVESREGVRGSRLADTYPFHPDLIDTLTDKTATLADFQRVRGMLRILAKTVAGLWARRAPDAFAIHTHHIDLGQEDVQREFTTRLGQSAFVPAINNDVAGPAGKPALAQAVDADMNAGLLPYASYAARTIFVHTLAFNNELRGITPAQLRYSIASPASDLDLLDASLVRFQTDSAYLDDRPGAPLRFNAEANLTQIIAREEKGIDAERIRLELDSRIKDIFSGDRPTFDPILFPAGAFDVPDDVGDGKPRLVVVKHETLEVSSQLDAVPEFIARMYTRKGAEEDKIRLLRNNLVFLLADERAVSQMREAMSRRIALAELKRPERLVDLADHQQQEILRQEQRSEQAVAVAIQGCYRHLLYPSKAALGDGSVSLGYASIDNPSTAEKPGAGQVQVVRQLSASNKLKSPEDAPDAPAYIRDRTPLKSKRQMTAAALREEFRRDPSLPIQIGDDPFKKIVRKGIEDGVFVYRREDLVAGQGEPMPSIVIDESSVIFTADYAKEHGIWPRPAPTTGGGVGSGGIEGGGTNSADGGSQGGETTAGAHQTGAGGPATGDPGATTQRGAADAGGASPGTVFMHEGVLKEALNVVFQKARSAKAVSLASVTISPFDYADAFKLLPVAEGVPDATKHVEMEGDLATAAGGELSIRAEGTLTEMKGLREFVEPLLRAASEKRLEVVIRLDFASGLALDGDAPERIVDRLTRFGAAAAFVEASAKVNS
ncbi:hypothetical protein GGR88_000613 [Sphingomonas jejuensis]|uniref:ATP-binding protein n=1 Tax=Sphingomonas jejuensis TaxID=904715 RepID=A0ABX0XIT9_9SPHN|nr:DUF499 domain-containing protein [Sphingomonas jejuensis]NJC33139.1 hypothetical protein [Sphingomonas jejuensis]